MQRSVPIVPVEGQKEAVYALKDTDWLPFAIYMVVGSFVTYLFWSSGSDSAHGLQPKDL